MSIRVYPSDNYQDINNTATPLMIKESIEVFVPTYMEVLNKLLELKDEWSEVPLLARTHGQAASTRLERGYGIYWRLEKQMFLMNTIPFSAKFGGATGNFNL